MYHIDLNGPAIIGRRLPPEFVGLDRETLAHDMGWWNTDDPDVPGPLAGVAFWPAETVTPTFDPATHRLGADTDEAPDAARRVVVVTPNVVALTAEELAERRAARAAVPLTPLEFARRLSAAERIAIRASIDPVVVDFLWMLDRAREVRLDDPDTIAGVGYLEAAGLLGAGRAAAILEP